MSFPSFPGHFRAHRRRYIFVLLSFLLFGVYSRGFSGGFVCDDRNYFLDNDILPFLKPWDLKQALCYPSNYGIEHFPVRDFLYVLEYYFFGKAPFGYHVVSLVIYWLCGLALYRFLDRYYSDKALRASAPASGPDRRAASVLFITAFFLFHPVHVEAVSVISQQKDLLFGLFSLLSLYFFYYAVGRETGIRPFVFAAAVLLYYLSVLSKDTGIATGLFLPLFWFMFIRKAGDKIAAPALLWMAVQVPVLFWIRYSIHIRHTFQRGLEAVTIPLFDRIVRGVKILGAHALLGLKPFPLSFGYPFNDATVIDLNALAGLAVILIFLFFVLRRRRHAATLGLLIFLVYLLPALQIFVQIFNAFIFDRYLFIPVIGLGMVAEGGISAISRRLPAFGRIAWGTALLVLAAFCFITFSYIPAFRSDVATSRNTYRYYPEWSSSAFNYAYALIEEGRYAEAQALIEGDRTLEKPLWVRSYLQGWIALDSGDIGYAIRLLAHSAGLAVEGGYYPYPAVPLARALIINGELSRARLYLDIVMSSPIHNTVEFYRAKKMLEELQGSP